MLKKRIIPCLDIKKGRTVKGVQFEGLRDAGDPVELAKLYAEQGADEVVFLDISATIERRQTLYALVEEVAKVLDIPFTVGGGIKSLDEAKRIIDSGADKISINSAAVKTPELISQIARQFGQQCVVLAIDSKRENKLDFVCTHGGRVLTDRLTEKWAKEGVQRGAGEILLTSMKADGTKAGFDIGLNQAISEKLDVPIIASGGAGTEQHFYEVFTRTDCSGALAASIFHFKEIGIQALKQYLKNKEIPIR